MPYDPKDKGAINSLRVIQRMRELPRNPRIWTRYRETVVGRDRRRAPVEFGQDELEARAQQDIVGTLPERIVYKKLQQLVGANNFLFQRTEGGGRNILGGYVIDFLVTDRIPPLALEVQGTYWHQQADGASNFERQLAVTRLGYTYAEIFDTEIYHSEEYFEERMRQLLFHAG